MRSTRGPALPVSVVADDRERGGGVLPHLASMTGVDLSVARLVHGDYLVDNRLCVERKTVRDFAASIIDGRLFAQARRLARTPQRACVILEGSVPLGREHVQGVRRRALQGAVVTLTLVLGLPVLRASTPAETAELMLLAARQLSQSLKGRSFRRGFGTSGGRRQRLFMLQGIPGVGAERANALLNHFATLAAVFAATEKELRGVPGIGRGLAKAIRQLGHCR